MKRLLNPELALGFLIATLLWIGVLGWQASYAPTDSEKRQCEETARHAAHKAEECKTLWERTTTDPVAFFTLWLVIFTGGLTVSTILLWRAGEKQARHARRSSAMQTRDMQASIKVGQDAAIAAAKSADAALNLHRPWVKVELEPTTTILEDAGLNFRAMFTIRMLNIGTTPATRVQVQLTIGAGLKRFDRARERLRPRVGDYGRTLFPNETSNRVIYVHVSKKEDFQSRRPSANPQPGRGDGMDECGGVRRV
jgi:hypothetical protein